MATTAPNADAALLANFAAYADAVVELERAGDIDDPKCPICAVWNAARDAIDASPPPTTVAGAIALLRFGLAVNNTTHDEQLVLLLDAAECRAAYCREQWPAFSNEVRPYWGALVALEAIEEAAKAETPPQPPSLIMALHARYEAAWTEYNVVDADKTKLEAGASDRSGGAEE